MPVDVPDGVIRAWVRRIAPLEPGEGRAVLWSAAFHFCLLGGYYMLRPVRESFGIERGWDRLPWLMTATMIAVLLVNPLFAALVSRVPRRRFVPITYRLFSACVLVFFGLFQLLPVSGHVYVGYVFYVWLSVFNLFVVSVYWGFMADLFGKERALRIFGFVAIGGTLGAIAGPLITAALIEGIKIGPQSTLALDRPTILLLSIIPLEAAAQCARRLIRLFGLSARTSAGVETSLRRADTGEPRPGIFKGVELVARSPYLLLLCTYLVLYSLLNTYVYLEQARIVVLTFPDPPSTLPLAEFQAAKQEVGEARTVATARIDLWVNVLTLATQLFLTSSILRRLGIGRALTIVPLITAAGFAALWASPVFGLLMAFQVLRRGLHYGVDRPAREVLYTILGPDEKYKSKPFIDTFVYRGGDMLGAWSPALLALLAVPVGAAAVPLAIGWGCVGLALGARHRRLARSSPPKPGDDRGPPE